MSIHPHIRFVRTDEGERVDIEYTQDNYVFFRELGLKLHYNTLLSMKAELERKALLRFQEPNK